MDGPTATPDGPAAAAAETVLAEPSVPAASLPASAPARQRWRLVLARSVDATDLGGRELADAWESALEASGLPAFIPVGRGRARVAFAAPIPAGLVAEAELADILLTSFEPAWRVRAALEVVLPSGWRLVDLYDVWLGAPALAGQIVAADYRITVSGADVPDLARAAATLLAANHLSRERQKGNQTVTYDLRPLIADLEVVGPGPAAVLRTRTRFHPELGTGRPSEVVAALAEAAGVPLATRSIVRERLVLAGPPDGSQAEDD
ncbi:MAG: TIGR03936 family radical SAM-associated protein [Chloroflexota bacterium]